MEEHLPSPSPNLSSGSRYPNPNLVQALQDPPDLGEQNVARRQKITHRVA